MIDRILVSLDGSGLAEQALPAAAMLAESGGAEIVLMTSIAPMERWADAQTTIWEEEESALAKGYLDTLARPLRENGLQVRTRVVWGRAGDMICATADDESADLVLMTTHGRTGVRRLLIGSVADNVLRRVNRPLLLLHPTDTAPKLTSLNRVLVPLDGSELAESVLPLVMRLINGTGATVILERVVVPPAFLYAEQYIPSSTPVLGDLEAEAQDYLEAIQLRLEANGCKVVSNVDVGFPDETIVDAAERFGTELIALTSHGRTGAERTLMGSVADDVVRSAGRPCLVVPARVTAPHIRDVELPAPTTLGIEAVPITMPAPSIIELPVGAQKRVKAPPVRPHRPEDKTHRKA